MTKTATRRLASAGLLLPLLLWGTACNRQPSDETARVDEVVPPVFTPDELLPDDALRARIDEVLDFTEARRLDAGRHAAWQIVHGVLAFGPNFHIEVDGELVPALRYLLDGGELRGWNLRPTDHGLEAPLESGSNTGQGHEDQWIGYLCQSELTADEPLVYRGKDYKLGDLVTQAQWDIREGMEASWTLMGLCTFLPLDATWTASDGQEWSIERIMRMELDELNDNLPASPCGGTHRLVGLTMALNRYLAQGHILEGIWKEVDEKIQWALTRAQRFQQADGSLSANYFERPATTQDVADRINSIGHTLEFITYAIEQDRLSEPWIAKAVLRLCDLLELTRDEAVECGALYHAAHGLVLYRLRRFDAREYETPAETDVVGAATDRATR